METETTTQHPLVRLASANIGRYATEAGYNRSRLARACDRAPSGLGPHRGLTLPTLATIGEVLGVAPALFLQEPGGCPHCHGTQPRGFQCPRCRVTG